MTRFGLRKQLIQREELSAVALEAGAIGEVTLFMLECWLLNLDGGFGTSDFLRSFSILNRAFAREGLRRAVAQLLEDEKRFDPSRMNVFVTTSDIDECIDSISRSSKREEMFAPLFVRHLRCSLLFNQMLYIQDAIRALGATASSNQPLRFQYDRRIEALRQEILDLERSGPGELGRRFDSRLHSVEKCIGIDEIDFGSGGPRCPRCGAGLRYSICLTLKAFRTADCPGCSALLVPVHVDHRTPGIQSPLPEPFDER